MDFKKYQHVGRLGTTSTEGILNGYVYVQPKIDGCNTTIYLDDNDCIHIAGRNKEYEKGTKNDRGLINYIESHIEYRKFLLEHKGTRLYMEYLVPHSLRTYFDDAWRVPYVFDAMKEDESYWVPSTLHAELESYGIPYVPNLWEGDGSDLTAEKIKELVNGNKFLVDPEKGEFGEGIVIKNYTYKNPYGDIIWAKVLHDEFNNHSNVKGRLKDVSNSELENEIATLYITKDFVNKEYAKILNDDPFIERHKVIPMLLTTCWHEFICEETYNFVKKFRCPKVDFKTLNQVVIKRIKELKPELF